MRKKAARVSTRNEDFKASYGRRRVGPLCSKDAFVLNCFPFNEDIQSLLLSMKAKATQIRRCEMGS